MTREIDDLGLGPLDWSRAPLPPWDYLGELHQTGVTTARHMFFKRRPRELLLLQQPSGPQLIAFSYEGKRGPFIIIASADKTGLWKETTGEEYDAGDNIESTHPGYNIKRRIVDWS